MPPLQSTAVVPTSGLVLAVPDGPGFQIQANSDYSINLDGEILNGNTVVDESIVTGESTPTPKQAGNTVLSGSINLSNIVRIKVTKTQENSTFNQIAEMVKKAQFSKPAIQNSIDKMTSFFVPGIMIIACLTL